MHCQKQNTLEKTEVIQLWPTDLARDNVRYCTVTDESDGRDDSISFARVNESGSLSFDTYDRTANRSKLMFLSMPIISPVCPPEPSSTNNDGAVHGFCGP